MNLSDINREWDKYIVLKDEHILETILATLVGNILITKDPLWLMVIAPSSGGKSTLIAPACAVTGVHFVDDLTEKTFLSGYKVKGRETSLLKIIGNGVLAFSDFTAVLAKNPNSRYEILGQLRLVYDGKFSRRTGMGEITWAGKMGFMGACTPDIYHILETARSMGERYLYYWMDQPTDEEIVKKQEKVNMSAREISGEMEPLYKEYIEGVDIFIKTHGLQPLKMTREQTDAVNAAAIFCASAKATVHLDFKTNKPDALVSKPGVGRDRKMFQTLLHALQVMRAYELGVPEEVVNDRMIDIVKKVAWSSVGRERRKILEILTKYDTTLSASEIGATDDFGLQKDGIEKYLWSLHAVGLVQKSVKGNGFGWYIESEATKAFVRSLSGVVVEKFVKSEADEIFDDYESTTV